jgi:hypothetical protein
MNPNLFSLLALAQQAFVEVDAGLQQEPVKSVTKLRAEVLRWRDERRPEVDDSECERLVRWFNRSIYHLEDY